MLELSNLGKYFPIRSGILMRIKSYVKAVDGVDLVVDRGDTLAVIGETGSGKTTLGRTAIRLLEPSFGTISFEGEDVTRARGKELKRFRLSTGIVFQDPNRSLHPRKKILDTVTEPLQIHRIAEKEEARRRAEELFELVGLSKDLIVRYPHQLSGGQRQRASIVRALIYKPKLLVLDEPTSALDVMTQAQILNILKNLKKELGLTYIFISHNLQAVYYIANKVAIMYLGKIVEIGSVDEIFENPLHPYTMALLTSIPASERLGQIYKKARVEIVGEPPSPVNPPPGCRFHPRCPFAKEICRRETPVLEKASNTHYVACHLWRSLPV